MNDISIMTKKIAKFKVEHETERTNDRGYSDEEIQTLVNSASLRLKVIFLVMASTGIRIGALPILRLSDLKKMKGKGLYHLKTETNEINKTSKSCEENNDFDITIGPETRAHRSHESHTKPNFIKCPHCRFENVHQDVIDHHIKYGHNLET